MPCSIVHELLAQTTESMTWSAIGLHMKKIDQKHHRNLFAFLIKMMKFHSEMFASWIQMQMFDIPITKYNEEKRPIDDPDNGWQQNEHVCHIHKTIHNQHPCIRINETISVLIVRPDHFDVRFIVNAVLVQSVDKNVHILWRKNFIQMFNRDVEIVGQHIDYHP